MQNREYQLYDYHITPAMQIASVVNELPIIIKPEAKCNQCGWTGNFSSCIQEQADDHYQYMCPVCIYLPVADLTN